MRKLIGVLTVLISISLLIGCTNNTVKTSLDKEFTLAIGQTATIAGENLKIKFLDVTADSRCAKDVQCVWAGEVSCSLQITQNGISEQIELTQPGLSDAGDGQTVGNYNYKFTVAPYPESTIVIEKKDYRLIMTVSKP
jgi:uncharacterized Zn finger protein